MSVCLSVLRWGETNGYPNEAINHSLHAIEIAQYAADFFVQETRRSSHSFRSSDQLFRALIDNYSPTKNSQDSSFMQSYYFANNFVTIWRGYESIFSRQIRKCIILSEACELQFYLLGVALAYSWAVNIGVILNEADRILHSYHSGWFQLLKLNKSRNLYFVTRESDHLAEPLNIDTFDRKFIVYI